MSFEAPSEQPKKPSRRITIPKPKEDSEEGATAKAASPARPEASEGRRSVGRSFRFPPSPEILAKREAEARDREAAYGERLREARELLGDRVFGPEEVEKTFGFKPENIPPILYSRQDFEKAKELGEMLILRMDKDKDGNPLTMQRIQVLLEPSLVAEGKGKVGYSDWSQSTESFETLDTPKLEWKLVSMDLLSGSTNKDYIEQTALLRDYFAKNKLATPEELAECTDQRLKEIRNLMKTDWAAAAEALSNLLINKDHRTAPVEDIYDLVVPLKSRNTRRLENVYNWTSRRGSDGDLVCVGRFAAQGALRGWWGPDDRDGDLGVCSVR